MEGLGEGLEREPRSFRVEPRVLGCSLQALVLD